MTSTPPDPWHRLRSRTPARIALGRSGGSLPTREVLAFALAHARARDAVHAYYDRDRLADQLTALGLETILADSEATDRAFYLRRPDLGRRLAPDSRDRLRSRFTEKKSQLAIVIADGLSAAAIERQALDFVKALLPHLSELGLDVGPIFLATGARVALGDEIGEVAGAELVAVLIGERPGLSAADNMSVYLTYNPAIGRNDAERNCISNIGHGRLAPDAAAGRLAWLISAARERKLTGVALKDASTEMKSVTSAEND